ncbi:MAG: glycosyltransferase [Bacteriovoracia bacterium]
MSTPTHEITAVLIPCLNEEKTIGAVVRDFKKELPNAQIFVFDNASTDKTSEVARAAGATVIYSAKRGKGNVVRHMFSTVQADIYILVDGDSTYPASAVHDLLRMFKETASDMVVGTRLKTHKKQSFRSFHIFGNRLVATLIATFFRVPITDVLSGYRVFSNHLVKTLPLTSQGFEIETELTLNTVTKGYKITEVPISYGERPEGSFSKLNTYTDGFLVLKAIFMIFKDHKPLLFFSAISLVFAILSLAAGFLPIRDYYQFQYVYHVPLAILAAGFGILSVIVLSIGLILDTVRKYQRENFELFRKLLSR